jgi:uncharacterized membrane protein
MYWPTSDLIALCFIVAVLSSCSGYIAGVLAAGASWAKQKDPQ